MRGITELLKFSQIACCLSTIRKICHARNPASLPPIGRIAEENFLGRVVCFFLQGGNDQAIQTHAAPRRFECNLPVQVTANPHVE